MNYVEPKTHPTKRRENVFRIFRPLAGATIGFFSIPIMVRLLLWDTQSTSLFSIVMSCLGLALLSPGSLVSNHIFGGSWWYGSHQEYIAEMLPNVITWGISVIPPILIGFLIGSYNKLLRISGILSLAVYGLFLFFASLFWLFTLGS